MNIENIGQLKIGDVLTHRTDYETYCYRIIRIKEKQIDVEIFQDFTNSELHFKKDQLLEDNWIINN